MRKRISSIRTLGFKDSGPQEMPNDIRKDWNPNFKPADSLEGVRKLQEWRRQQSSTNGWRFSFPPWPWVIDWWTGRVMSRTGKTRHSKLIAAIYDNRGRFARWNKRIVKIRRRKTGISEMVETAAAMWLIRAAPELAEAMFMAVCWSPDKPIPRSLRSRMVSLLIKVGVIAEEERMLFLEGLVTNGCVEVVKAMEKMGHAEGEAAGGGDGKEPDAGTGESDRRLGNDYYRSSDGDGGEALHRVYDPRVVGKPGRKRGGRDSGNVQPDGAAE